VVEYLDCVMEGIKAMGGDSIRMPERRRFDPEESCMYLFFRTKEQKRNIYIYITIVDETSTTADMSRRPYRQSTIEEPRRKQSAHHDEPQSPIINLFSARQT
jgi:hypothetical protein